MPIVAYDIDWYSEAVETGVTGELVFLNYSLMADAIEKIINDEEYGKMIGKMLRTDVKNRIQKPMIGS